MLKISKAQIAHFIAAPIVLGITLGSAWCVQHFPGLPGIPPEMAGAIGSGVGIAAAGYALHYLKGLREWQRLVGEGVIVEEEGEPIGEPDTLDPATAAYPITKPSSIPPDEGDAGRAHVPPEGSAQ